MDQGRSHHIYETAFDCKVEKKTEESSDFIDRIANHPILQLFHRRKRIRSVSKCSDFITSQKKEIRNNVGNISVAKYNSNVSAKCRGNSRSLGICHSVSASTCQLSEPVLRPIGLSKSDDEILSRTVDLTDEEDFIDDYNEGQETKDISAELQSFHLNDDYFSKRVPLRELVKKSHSLCEEKDLNRKLSLKSKHVQMSYSGIHSPPGTAPLPIKFVKSSLMSSTHNCCRSNWLNPQHKDQLKPGFNPVLCMPSSNNSSVNSLNSSMEVLVGSSSNKNIKLSPVPPKVSVKYSSIDSIVTQSTMSSLESLQSNVSDGCKSTNSYESSYSNSKGLFVDGENNVARRNLHLSTPHRSLIHSGNFQILSPISDKSHEPSFDNGGFSQKCSPQDTFDYNLRVNLKTPVSIRNISDDFRNVHHILPGPVKDPKPHGSDSGISIEYNSKCQSKQDNMRLADLPFDMPKLRRKLAAAKASGTSLSSSNSSISSNTASDVGNVLQCLPHSIQPVMNPAISRVQETERLSFTSSSNSSDWETKSSLTESSDEQGTPTLRNLHLKRKVLQDRNSLNLELGCSAMSVKGENVDVDVPLIKQSWYHGSITRYEAERTLRTHPEGSYLVRSLDASRNDYSLALKSACGFMHLKVKFNCHTGGYTLGRDVEQFSSVCHMVQHFSIYHLPIKGADHMVLLHPVPNETL